MDIFRLHIGQMVSAELLVLMQSDWSLHAHAQIAHSPVEKILLTSQVNAMLDFVDI